LVEHLSRSKVSWKTWATTEDEEAGESRNSSFKTLSLRNSTSDLRMLFSALSSARTFYNVSLELFKLVILLQGLIFMKNIENSLRRDDNAVMMSSLVEELLADEGVTLG